MISLQEDAAKTFFLGVEVYAFGLYVALGMALCLIVLAVLMRRAKWKKGTVALTGVLAGLIGFFVSRLFFGLMDDSLGQPMPLWVMLRVTTGGYSMMGALLGACMGGLLSAKITKQNERRMLDFLAPALLLFVACERLGEGYIEEFGISRAMTVHLFENTFLTVEGGYGWHLKTYLLESFTAFVLAMALLRDLSGGHRAGDTFLMFLLLFGASQVLLESLRYDRHMCVNAFVRLQQVMAMMLLGGGVIVAAARGWKTKKGLAIAALLSIAATVGIGVAIEFMIDRSAVSHYLLYFCFLIVVSVPACLGMILRKEGQNGKA